MHFIGECFRGSKVENRKYTKDIYTEDMKETKYDSNEYYGVIKKFFYCGELSQDSVTLRQFPGQCIFFCLFSYY